MKLKTLEKAIILGIILSNNMCGTIFAGELTNVVESPDGKTVTITNENLYMQNGKEPTVNGKTLAEYQTVIVNKDTSKNRDFGLDVCTLQEGQHKDFSNTDFIITMNGNAMNADALHLRNWENNIKIKNFTAYVNTLTSDAINIGHESTSSTVQILGDLEAEVLNGNGIRANASVHDERKSTIIVDNTTHIILNSDKVQVETSKEKYGLKVTVTKEYNPAAVYAGNSSCNFHYSFMGQSTDFELFKPFGT